MTDVVNEFGAGPPAEQAAFHPIDSRDAGSPDAKLAELRRSCPVSRAAREGFPPVTVVAKYDDVAAVFRNWRAFGNIGSDPDPTVHDRTPVDRQNIIELDPPAHSWARRLDILAMAPGAVEAALDYVSDIAGSLVDGFVERGEADLVAEWAEPLPSLAIARVLGLPTEDAPILHGWVASQHSESAVKAAGRAYGVIPVLGGAFEAYLHEQIAKRREPNAPDDALARMVQFQREDGSYFSDDEISIHVRTLLNAGNETTTSLMSNLVYRLLGQPGLYERVANNRALIPMAIEESLRLDAPLQVIIRRASRDAQIGGCAVAAGDVLALSTLSANRDETVWGESAERFDIDRFAPGIETAAHMGFGLGIHHCVGAYLARQTTTRGFDALLDRIPTMRLADGFVYENVFRHVFHRPRQLPVVFPAGRSGA